MAFPHMEQVLHTVRFQRPATDALALDRDLWPALFVHGVEHISPEVLAEAAAGRNKALATRDLAKSLSASAHIDVEQIKTVLTVSKHKSVRAAALTAAAIDRPFVDFLLAQRDHLDLLTALTRRDDVFALDRELWDLIVTPTTTWPRLVQLYDQAYADDIDPTAAAVEMGRVIVNLNANTGSRQERGVLLQGLIELDPAGVLDVYCDPAAHIELQRAAASSRFLTAKHVTQLLSSEQGDEDDRRYLLSDVVWNAMLPDDAFAVCAASEAVDPDVLARASNNRERTPVPATPVEQIDDPDTLKRLMFRWKAKTTERGYTMLGRPFELIACCDNEAMADDVRKVGVNSLRVFYELARIVDPEFRRLCARFNLDGHDEEVDDGPKATLRERLAPIPSAVFTADVDDDIAATWATAHLSPHDQWAARRGWQWIARQDLTRDQWDLVFSLAESMQPDTTAEELVEMAKLIA